MVPATRWHQGDWALMVAVAAPVDRWWLCGCCCCCRCERPASCYWNRCGSHWVPSIL